MIVLLLVTQNEGDLLRWNIRHHLEWGVDHVAVADNASTDSTADVAHDFGEQVSYQSFPDFLKRQGVRTAMLDDLRGEAHGHVGGRRRHRRVLLGRRHRRDGRAAA